MHICVVPMNYTLLALKIILIAFAVIAVLMVILRLSRYEEGISNSGEILKKSNFLSSYIRAVLKHGTDEERVAINQQS